MNDEAWAWLMKCARTHAALYQERAHVQAIEVPPRAARRRGGRWAYILVAPANVIAAFSDEDADRG